MMPSKSSLSNGTILLRPCRSSDTASLWEALQEFKAEFPMWLPALARFESQEEVAAWLETQVTAWGAGEAYLFLIADAKTLDVLGVCGLTQFNLRHRFANLHYWVRPSAAGRGIASAAVRMLAGFAFRELSLNRVEIVIATENAQSLRVAEKSGALREGVLRNRIDLNGTLYDALMFSLIPQDVQDGDAEGA